MAPARPGEGSPRRYSTYSIVHFSLATKLSCYIYIQVQSVWTAIDILMIIIFTLRSRALKGKGETPHILVIRPKVTDCPCEKINARKGVNIIQYSCVLVKVWGTWPASYRVSRNQSVPFIKLKASVFGIGRKGEFQIEQSSRTRAQIPKNPFPRSSARGVFIEIKISLVSTVTLKLIIMATSASIPLDENMYFKFCCN